MRIRWISAYFFFFKCKTPVYLKHSNDFRSFISFINCCCRLLSISLALLTFNVLSRERYVWGRNFIKIVIKLTLIRKAFSWSHTVSVYRSRCVCVYGTETIKRVPNDYYSIENILFCSSFSSIQIVMHNICDVCNWNNFVWEVAVNVEILSDWDVFLMKRDSFFFLLSYTVFVVRWWHKN